MAVWTIFVLLFDKDKLPLHIALIQQALWCGGSLYFKWQNKSSKNLFCLDLEDIKWVWQSHMWEMSDMLKQKNIILQIKNVRV